MTKSVFFFECYVNWKMGVFYSHTFTLTLKLTFKLLSRSIFVILWNLIIHSIDKISKATLFLRPITTVVVTHFKICISFFLNSFRFCRNWVRNCLFKFFAKFQLNYNEQINATAIKRYFVLSMWHISRMAVVLFEHFSIEWRLFTYAPMICSLCLN